MTALPLVFDAPRRGMPPQHLADLDRDQRRAVVHALGEPAFRADQLARHYFARLTTDPAAMTDLPAPRRSRLAAALLPELATPVRHVSCDGGTTLPAGGGRGVLRQAGLRLPPGGHGLAVH